MVLTGYSDPLECSVGLELPLLRLTRADVTPFIQLYYSSDGSATPRRKTALTGASARYEVRSSKVFPLNQDEGKIVRPCVHLFFNGISSRYIHSIRKHNLA